MEIVNLTQATEVVTLFISFITSNIPMVVAILGTVVGVNEFRKAMNAAQVGKFGGSRETWGYTGEKLTAYNDYLDKGGYSGEVGMEDFEESYSKKKDPLADDYGQSALEELREQRRINKRLMDRL
jgi:hypothetical protein